MKAKSDRFRIVLSDGFVGKLSEQVEYIALDKPFAARKFKNDVLLLIRSLAKMPYKHRKSIYFDKSEIRDMVFKGYKIIYKIDTSRKSIMVFGLIKEEENLSF
jgi:plasmid stabilization system protein ParE